MLRTARGFRSFKLREIKLCICMFTVRYCQVYLPFEKRSITRLSELLLELVHCPKIKKETSGILHFVSK